MLCRNDLNSKWPFRGHFGGNFVAKGPSTTPLLFVRKFSHTGRETDTPSQMCPCRAVQSRGKAQTTASRAALIGLTGEAKRSYTALRSLSDVCTTLLAAQLSVLAHRSWAGAGKRRRTSGRALLDPMRILLTNDDGIGAPGLEAAWKELNAAGHEVFVCCPDRPRSAIGHAITMH